MRLDSPMGADSQMMLSTSSKGWALVAFSARASMLRRTIYLAMASMLQTFHRKRRSPTFTTHTAGAIAVISVREIQRAAAISRRLPAPKTPMHPLQTRAAHHHALSIEPRQGSFNLAWFSARTDRLAENHSRGTFFKRFAVKYP